MMFIIDIEGRITTATNISRLIFSCSFFTFFFPSFCGSCRIGGAAFFAVFVAPVMFVMLVNTITFCLIMYKLATRPPNTADPTSGNEGFRKIKRAFGILILVGITWVFGFFAIADASLVLHYLFAICNSLQGFSIFVFYCVTQRKVRECWKALLTCDLGRLKKSRSLFRDSYYDRRRLSSASRIQLDTMRPRTNTGMSQVGSIFFVTVILKVIGCRSDTIHFQYSLWRFRPLCIGVTRCPLSA